MVASTSVRPRDHSISKLLWSFLSLYATATVLAVDANREVSIVEGTVGGVTVIDISSEYAPSLFYISADLRNSRHVFHEHFTSSSGKIVTQHEISRDLIAAELNNPHLLVMFEIKFTVFTFAFDQVAIINTTLRILDLDNNEPTFMGYENKSYPIMLSEGESGFGILPLVTDGDEGVNSTQDYNLVLSPDLGYLFSLEVKRTKDNGIVTEVRLVQNGTLDREQQSNYMLQVIATEGNMNPQSTTLMINVTVLDVCDETPMFPNSRFYATIKENSPSGIVLLSNITATDTDILDVGKIRYRINQLCSSRYEDSACLPLANFPFQLDRESGDLTVIVDDIDRETFAVYELTIIAEDSCMREVTATVEVLVENINDNFPILTLVGLGDVYETQLVNSTIFFFTVRDDDYGRDRDSPLFSITLHENSTGVLLDTDVFFLFTNVDKLELRLGQDLDREVVNEYSLVINVTDWGTPNMSSINHLLIKVLDVNDNPPIFQPVQSLYLVDEELVLGTAIAEVSATDRDSTSESGNGQVSYSIPPSNGTFPYQDYLTVDQNGDLMVARRIDREEQETFFVLVKAHDNPKSNPLTDYVVVNIKLNDINDNTPTIGLPQETLSILESLPAGSVVFNISAYDNDTEPFSTITYSFTTPASIPFQIDSISGSITLTTALDYETHTNYSFEVTASDGENEERRRLTIQVENVNDERCIFDELATYMTSVHEELPSNLRVFNVDATDKDTPAEQLRFSIVAGNEKNHFTINVMSGEIYTTLSLDNEMVSNYSLSIQCSDGSDSPTTISVLLQVIDINDNIPQFLNTPYTFTVSENLHPDNPVGVVYAVDADSSTNGAIRYNVVQVTPSSAFGWFTLDPNSGRIVTNRMLDREDAILEGRNGLVTLNVQAVDLPTSTVSLSNNSIVSIVITDQNDHLPVFELATLTMTVRENFVVGNALPERVLATDRDSPLNNAINYEISGSTPEAEAFFGVDINSGIIVLLSPLNFEIKERHEFIVLAIDPNKVEHRASQTVVINVMAPEVNITLVNFRHSVQVQENSPINHRVTQFGVTDNSGNPIMRTVDVTYTITNENGIVQSEDFGLMNDTENRMLIVYVKRNIDRETIVVGRNGLVQRVLNITVKSITHGSVSVHLTVTIEDQNDNHPVFLLSSYTFQVPENNDVSVPIGSVSATDTDFGLNGSAGISFQVADSTAFRVSVDGELRSTRSLDHETLASHNFYVIALDGATPPMTSRVAVKVTVGDLNDNRPVFNPSQNRTFFVGEEMRVNTVVAMLSVSDADSSLYGPVNVFIGDVLSQHFRIEPNGSITLMQSLDRETADSHFFTVTARDVGGKSSTANVTIIVEDYNDNAPVFNPVPTVILDENQQENVVFLMVTATDADIGYSGTVMYSIGNYTLSRTFCINTMTGEIRLCLQHISCQDEDVTNFERKRMYSISIVAYDLGTPRHIVSKTISIIIRPVNEHPPLFDRGMLFVYINETQDSNVEVARIRAIDQDKGDHVTYQVLSNNQQSDLFRYDTDRGAIINNGNLDYAAQAVHTITLRATDSGNMMDSIQVIIAVTNINNHPPVFYPNNQPNSFGQPLVIKESTPVSTVVWTIRASDDDNATHDAVSYHIGGEDDNMRFMIDSLTGEISINKSLDYEQRKSYVLNIYARDTGIPQMTSSTTVWISIQNLNDEFPIFNSTSYSFSVAENEPAMTVIGRVYAMDRDIDDYNVVHYSISQGINEYFDVDPTSGDIFTLREIDRDVLASSVVLFTVHAIDGSPGFDVNTAVANVEVVIVDLNDNVPELTATQYLISISPDQAPFILISTPILASDRDQGNNSQYFYAIEEDSPSNLAINVSSVTGQLMLKEPIPTDHQLAYIYTLRAVDSRDANLFSSARLEVLVETDGDHHPQFNPVVSTTSVSELSRSGSEVFVISSVVSDADSGDNGHLSYTFAQSYPKFSIDSESGRISLREMLDFEGTQVYNLTVQAMDRRAGLRRTATGVVQVNVSPGNEFVPRFVNLPSEFTLSYLPEVGLELFTVTATDQDEGAQGDVSYSIIDPNHYFAIGLHQGVVRNLRILESDQQFNVIIVARDAGTPFWASNTSIGITIRNAGSSTPNFIGLNPRPITKSEDITLGSFINTALITNPSAQSYHLVKQTVHGDTTPIEKFTITEGQGRVRIKETLDFEETNMYSIVVEARVTTTGSNSEQRASDFLHIILMVTNVNDNAPVFTAIEDQVFSENMPVSTTSLFQVEATDKDLGLEGMLIYDIIQGDSERTFKINSSAGHVYLRRPLDREVVSSYNLLIQAQDLSNQPHSVQIMIRVTITDVNDFLTTYGGRNYSLNVYESPSTRPGDRIIKLSATDLDEGPPLRYVLDLVEASHNAMPQNIYNLQSRFVIDYFSGFISVGTLALDREYVDYYMFLVTATDRVNTAKTYLTIKILDVNDNIPEVTVPDFRVRVIEGMPSGMLVTAAISTTDADVGINSWVKYSLGSGWPQNYFQIDPLSGVIRTNDVILASRSILSFSGEVIVEDQGISNRNSVTGRVYITIVDVNNHAPMFESDTITLMVSISTMPGTKVHKFNVTDEDFTVNASPLMFVIPNYFSDAVDNFLIDTGGGTLKLVRPQSEVRSFNFRVDVSNPSFTPSCVQYMQASSINVTVLITPINTACPAFSQAQYNTSIAEGDPDQNHVLIRIKASDVDGESISYSIADSTAPFSIHRTTGDLIGTGTLDRETRDNYQLIILATDGGYPPRTCSADVTIIVTDVNDNRPLFIRNGYTGSLRENSPINTSVVRVTANDMDLGGNGSVSYHLTPNKLPFRIDSNTGEIFSSGLLNYEAKLSYTFDVVASDGGNPASSSSVPIDILLIDVNEGAPKFTVVPDIPITVNANMVKGTHVYTVQATDPDIRTQLFFSFVNMAPKCYFEINNRTGEITLKVNPNSENTCSSTTTAQPSTSDPSYFIIKAVISVTDGEVSLNTTIDFSLHESFGMPIISTPQSFPTVIIIASVTGVMVVAISLVGILVVACICRAKRLKIIINKTPPESIEMKKKTFGNTGSGSSNNISMKAYKQASLGALPPEHTTMMVAASNTSSNRQSYLCNGDSEPGGSGGGGALGVHDRITYPSPSVVSNMSQLSKPYRSTSDLGSSTMATDKLSNGSQETAPYPKSQIERIYAKNADLLDSGSNESIHMFGSEGGGESDGGDDLYGKFNDLDDDDDSTTMQDDDEDDIDDDDARDYRRRPIPSTREGMIVSIPTAEGPYPPYSHTPAWAPQTNNMAENIDQYRSEKHVSCSQQFVAGEFNKSQGVMSGYQGGSSTQELNQSLLRHTRQHPHHHHHPQPQQPQQPEFYYDDVEQVQLHDHHMMRGVPPKYSLSSGPLGYSLHNSPRHLPIGRHPGGGMGRVVGKGGCSSQEVPPVMGGYGYHGDYMHHPMHLEMGPDTLSPPSSTPTEEALNTRALNNEYESDMMFSSDTSLNTNIENDQPQCQQQQQQQQRMQHPHQQMSGTPRGFSQPGPSQRVFSQTGSSQRNAYH